MSIHPLRRLPARGLPLLGAALWLAAAPTTAQAAPPVPPPTVPPAVAAPPTVLPGTRPLPPVVDPAARELFSQMVAAHKALRSWTMTVQTTDQTGGKPSSAGTLRIEFAKPARALVTLTRQGKALGSLVSSGTTLTRVDREHKAYRQDTLPAAAAQELVAQEIGNLGLLPRAYIDPVGLSTLLTAPGLVAVARVAGNEPVGTVAVDSVVARVVDSDGTEGRFTFFIGRTDHLLRQVEVVETPPPSAKTRPTLTHTETTTDLAANPALPASAFAYKPDAGYKKVAPPAPPR